MLSNLTSRFAKHVKPSASILRPLPSNIYPDSSVDHLEEAVGFYEEDLPNADLVDKEFHLWKSRWWSTPSQERLQTLSDAMKHCCPESLPLSTLC